MKAIYIPYTLQFKNPSGTSRGILTEKKCWFIKIYYEENSKIFGIGEVAPLKGLSIDDRDDLEDKLQEVCSKINKHEHWLSEGLIDFPSIRFGLETALLDLSQKGKRILFPTDFTKGKSSIKINGLVWMGKRDFMQKQIEQKLKEQFHCIKIKIGAIDFAQELELLKYIRKKFPKEQVELRLDANGAFYPDEALQKLEQLAQFDIHSIEQPIQQGQWKAMAELCSSTPLPIALDEELIEVTDLNNRKELLTFIKPQYIILKPTLLGGFQASKEWIDLVEENKTGWWITSALESNIGLNAIAQWTYTLNNPMPQGLGTGQLFTNNFPSPLSLKGENLFFHPETNWDLSSIA